MANTFKTNQTLVNSGFNQLSGETLILYGNTFIGSTGTFQYCTNQHNKYTAYSIADASYVTGQTSCIRHIGSNKQLIFRDVSGITGATYLIYNKILPSLVFGINNCAQSIDSAIIGGRNNYILSGNTGSTIIGGSNNYIASGNTGSTIIGGNNIILTGITYNNTVIVPNLAIWNTPQGSGNLLGWNNITKRVYLTTSSGGTGGGITGATNLGSGNGTIFTSVSGKNIQLKSLSGGTNINITCDANYIAINTTKNCISVYSAVTTSVTLTTGSSYVVLAGFSTAMSVMLPIIPLDGQSFKIKDICGCANHKNITICGNGNNIDGFACALINTDYGALELVYSSSPIAGWYSLGFVN